MDRDSSTCLKSKAIMFRPWFTDMRPTMLASINSSLDEIYCTVRKWDNVRNLNRRSNTVFPIPLTNWPVTKYLKSSICWLSPLPLNGSTLLAPVTHPHLTLKIHNSLPRRFPRRCKNAPHRSRTLSRRPEDRYWRSVMNTHYTFQNNSF